MEIVQKLAVLADAAKYDASCASSGGPKRDSLKSGGIGSTEGMGICHAYAPDGRCISLLKILLTNFCTYDCAYCINRRSSNVARARFSVDEVVKLTLDFYKRNYIEGLFLSSGIIRSPDYTMEQLGLVARKLRLDHRFGGYIHLKTIPDAAPELITEAGRWADRLSINVEMPTETGLASLAPEKNLRDIRAAMGSLRLKIDETLEEKRAPRFAPAGQSTQMIVGADAAKDRDVLETSDNLYRNYRLRRVYYSAFSPIPDASRVLPPLAPPLMREHRLYQADWLLRFYGFTVDDIVPLDAPDLPADIDPKTAWALRHREQFPVDVNRADRETLLRVPGLGVRNVERLLELRLVKTLRYDDLVKLRVPMKRVAPFIITADHRPRADAETANLRRTQITATQGDLFGA
ncbi:putative DNA modification/repair radical SAM protein [Panacagrimonas perspica]|uniref:Putative DNA modification/repair radical SAM protein n=1 Tax=Panacagrimonas perspica TaxID=381431 RepID=A0A4R7P3Y0_9GAMM|nr:putative DNA modification/repair radical SAM protein [Panacagrimonas perspica]TDU28079.1 putative DNA modification/repair radical SAM protein [Panacagrimonas perspica]THD03493.1 putative DNA modification/repair radical SAM protein [Panacagrimonas perspica]